MTGGQCVRACSTSHHPCTTPVMDTFICGLCDVTFHSLQEFIDHKQYHDGQKTEKTPKCSALNKSLTGGKESSVLLAATHDPVAPSESTNPNTSCPAQHSHPPVHSAGISCTTKSSVILETNLYSSHAENLTITHETNHRTNNQACESLNDVVMIEITDTPERHQDIHVKNNADVCKKPEGSLVGVPVDRITLDSGSHRKSSANCKEKFSENVFPDGTGTDMGRIFEKGSHARSTQVKRKSGTCVTTGDDGEAKQRCSSSSCGQNYDKKHPEIYSEDLLVTENHLILSPSTNSDIFGRYKRVSNQSKCENRSSSTNRLGLLTDCHVASTSGMEGAGNGVTGTSGDSGDVGHGNRDSARQQARYPVCTTTSSGNGRASDDPVIGKDYAGKTAVTTSMLSGSKSSLKLSLAKDEKCTGDGVGVAKCGKEACFVSESSKSSLKLNLAKDDKCTGDGAGVAKCGKEACVVSEGGCETTVVSVEGVAVAATGEECVGADLPDLGAASCLGIYTLLLNADNTFTLVAGGYQGSSGVAEGGQVYVCHRCRKFAQSQVEIFSHISACHPEDLDNINQCVAEFSALSSCPVSSDDQPAQPAPCQANKDKGPSHTHHTQHLSKDTTQKNIMKKKLGRPRKEDMVKIEPEPEKVKTFRIVNGSFVCLDCSKTFLKHRQFDKHKCSLWQANLDAGGVDKVAAASPPPGEGAESQSACTEEGELPGEDLGEEWTGSKYYKIKDKAGDGVKRKRGRPPKVTLTSGYGNEVHIPAPQDLGSVRAAVQQASISSTTQPVSHCSKPLLTLQSIPTLPLFSNPQQQERLHKWIAQIDLSFVDGIIDKIYPEKKKAEKTGLPMYACRECKVLYRTLLSCRRHCAKHLSKRAFTCPDCDFATSNVGALYCHYRSHTQNLYACDKCSFRARIKAHFRDHLETHYPSRHVCQLCQRPYSTSNSLKSHIYLNHRNEEGMNYLWSLRRKKQEQGKLEHRFQCPVCNVLFDDRFTANKHLSVHGISVLRDVVRCEVCKIEMLNQKLLRKHLQKYKVIYICCGCFEPQVTVNCLRAHLKQRSCNTLEEDAVMKSLLYSYVLPEVLPNLISNKKLGLGPQLRSLISSHGEFVLPSTRVRTSLIKQLESAGFRQVSELVQDGQLVRTDAAAVLRTGQKAVKIVVDTRRSSQHQQVWSEGFQLHPDTEAMDERVVVISSTEEEQLVVIEDGRRVETQEEGYIIVHEEGEEKSNRWAKYLAQISG